MRESGHDGKKKWRVLKTELKINKSRDEIKTVQKDENIISDPNEIAVSFKNHFETCAINLVTEVPDGGNHEILIEQKPDWFFTETTEEKLLKSIDSILPKSSSGFDLLSNRMLKKEKKQFAKILLNLINETIMGNVYPEVLKIAKIIPIFKKGDNTNLNNYRPIVLLPVLSKVLEKVINDQITSKLDELKLIDDNQYGFRAGHSTEDAVLKFINHIEKAKKIVNM